MSPQEDQLFPIWMTEAATLGRPRHIEKIRSPLLYVQGYPALHIILIVRGFIMRTYNSYPYMPDKASVLDIHGPHEFVGHTAALNPNMPYPDSARIASESADVISFDTAQFVPTESTANGTTRVVSSTIRVLLRNQIARDEKRMQDHISWLKYAEIEQKVMLYILELVDRFEVQRQDGATEIELSLSQIEFASFIGASREHVSRTLTKLKAKKLIIFGKGKIVIPNVQKLRMAVYR